MSFIFISILVLSDLIYMICGLIYGLIYGLMYDDA